MYRLTLVLLILAGCDSSSSKPDAPIVIDAAPDAPGIDAFVCVAPMKTCGTACIDVTTDESNCGDCNVTCKGGESCSTTCMCPAPFVPATIAPTSFDQFQAMGGIMLAIAPNLGAAIDPIVFGYDANVQLDQAYDLAAIGVGGIPFVSAAYNFDPSMMTADAYYAVTAGTLRFTKLCGTEAQGTLTNATFQGVTGGFQNPVVDPAGCTFNVSSLAFHMMTAACP